MANISWAGFRQPALVACNPLILPELFASWDTDRTDSCDTVAVRSSPAGNMWISVYLQGAGEKLYIVRNRI